MIEQLIKMQNLHRTEWEDAYLRSIQGPKLKQSFENFVYNFIKFGGYRKPSKDTLSEWAAEPKFQQDIRTRQASMRKEQVDLDEICKCATMVTRFCDLTARLRNCMTPVEFCSL